MAGARLRLAHFLGGIVEAHDARAHGGQAGRGHHEGFAVEGVEALGDVAGQLEMLRLVVSHGHNGRLVEQNVGRHQHRVLQQPVAHRFLHRRLGLVLGHALQPADRSDAGEHPGQLRVRRHRRLHHNGALVRVDARRQVERGQFEDLGAQLGGVLVEGDRVQVYDTENGFVVGLDAHPVLQRAQIIADVQVARGLHPGEDSWFHARVSIVP